tara:strand:+ start:4064 stop:4582 length:519 start_codon:yes stop_codon:yes gene_type:complete
MLKSLFISIIILISTIGSVSVSSDAPPTKKQDFIARISHCYTGFYEANDFKVAIPIEMVLGISIHESAWGKSRFAVEGYNYFGLRTTAKDKKHYMTPKGAPSVKVAKFERPCGSVHFFLNLISTDPRYSKLYSYLSQVRPVDIEEALGYMDIYYQDPAWPKKVLKIIKGLDY